MVVAVLTVELHIPGAASLKEKRLVLRSIKDRIQHKFNVSVAELDFLDKWQRSRIGVAQIGNDFNYVEKSINTIFRLLDSQVEFEITHHSLEYF